MRPSLHSVLEGSAFLTVRSNHAAVPFGFRRQVRRCFNHVRSSDVGRFQQGERMRIGAPTPSSRCRNNCPFDSCLPSTEFERWHPFIYHSLHSSSLLVPSSLANVANWHLFILSTTQISPLDTLTPERLSILPGETASKSMHRFPGRMEN